MRVSDLHVCLAVTGAVAAQGTAAVCHFLKREVGIKELDLAITRSASRFVTTETLFQSVGRSPLCEWEDYDRFGPGGHIRFANMIDLMIVLPASANFIGSLASGQTYSPMLMIALATRSPVAVIPSINSQVWDHPVVQSNAALLRKSGVTVMENPAGLSLGNDAMQPGSEIGLPTLMREIFDLVKKS